MFFNYNSTNGHISERTLDDMIQYYVQRHQKFLDKTTVATIKELLPAIFKADFDACDRGEKPVISLTVDYIRKAMATIDEAAGPFLGVTEESLEESKSRLLKDGHSCRCNIKGQGMYHFNCPNKAGEIYDLHSSPHGHIDSECPYKEGVTCEQAGCYSLKSLQKPCMVIRYGKEVHQVFNEDLLKAEVFTANKTKQEIRKAWEVLRDAISDRSHRDKDAKWSRRLQDIGVWLDVIK